MAFTAKDVMALREITGAGMMDCKKALTECAGDVEKAKDFLREKGLAAAAKKASRIAAEGLVGAFVTADYGVLVEVNCETDFVTKTDNFKALVDAVALQAGKTNPADIESLLDSDYVEEPGKSFRLLVNEASAKIGEKISVRRFVRYDGATDSYIHLGGKIGVLVETNAAPQTDAAREAIHGVALQIAAAKPTYIEKSEVPTAEVEHEMEILRAQAKNEPKPKPDAIIEKMVHGRVDKYYKEVCLMEQLFVKDQDKTVAQMLSECGQDLKVIRFTRFEMGEGLQKRQDDFAQEVMSQMNT
ncbi:MAG: translation elongation factor Ts [Clostridia bacterium]